MTTEPTHHEVKPLTGALRRHLLVWGVTAAVLLLLVGVFLYRRWAFGSAHFAYSIGRTPDELLPVDQEPLSGVDLTTTTADDFPGFLGVNRRAAIEHVTLSPDWHTHSPRLLWRLPIGAGYSAFAIVNGFAVTMEQRGPQEQVTCYAMTSGKHHWSATWNERFTINGIGPRSTPTIAHGRVFALSAWGHLVCINGNTGEVVWQRELLRDLGIHWSDEHRHVRFGRANSPLVTEKLVIVPGGGLPGKCSSLLAFDAATGEPRWRGGDRQISYSSPILAELLGELQVVTVNENTVSGHSPDTGRELWTYPWPGDSGTDVNASQPVPLSSSRILLSKGYRRGAAVIELTRSVIGEPMKTRCVWRQSSVLCTKYTNVVVWNNHAYGLSDGALECVDLGTGQSCWKAGKYGDGQILRVRDLLLVLNETGELVLVRLDPHASNAVVGHLRVLTGTTCNNLALYGRYLLVRNATEAASYELPLATDDW